MSVVKTPRPTPKFFTEQQTFSTKKEKLRPRILGNPPPTPCPPRPPVKSYPPVSRVFQIKQDYRAQPVSFRDSTESVALSPNYNKECRELYFDQCFEIISKLGAGSFGEVFKVRSKEDGKFYAVKRSRDRFRGESDRKRKLEEVAKHEFLPKHPNCVGFVKAWEERHHLYIQTELCEASLNTFAENNHDIPESLVWNYMVDLLLALKHLHDQDLVHMDIKPENIFISKDGTCKLGDFGLVLSLVKSSDFSEAQEGDPKYLAPELMQGTFGKAADIFSLGITVLELASDLDLPRGGDAWHQLREGKLPDAFLKGMSHDLRYIIQQMMEPDHTVRPSAERLLSVPSVNQVWKRRQRQIYLRKMKYLFLKVLQQMVAMFLFVWWLVTAPLRSVFPKGGCTPSNRSHTGYTHNWDQSFSDDDVFDEDIINISDNSLGAPLDSSTSSEPDAVFAKPCLPARIAKTTPGGIRNRVCRTQTPSRSASPGFRFSDRFSPGSTTSTPSPQVVRTPVNNEIDVFQEPRLSIGPKNLLDVFEAVSSDED